MTQQSVYNLLNRKKKWMTSKQIAVCLEINRGSVLVTLNKLFNQGEILRNDLDPNKGLSGSKPKYWKTK